MSRMQSKNHRTETYGIGKISFCCFDDKIFILDNGIDALPLGY